MSRAPAHLDGDSSLPGLLAPGEVASGVHGANRPASGSRFGVSGGSTMSRAAEVAAPGVDVIAVGSLTHSAGAVDIAVDLRA